MTPKMNLLEAYHFHERDWDSYEELRRTFEWDVPEYFNKAHYICDRWAKEHGNRDALYAVSETGEIRDYTFAELKYRSDALAAYFRDAGVTRGDRVAVSGAQKPGSLVGHLAAWKIGAVSVPVSMLSGPDALKYRLANAGVKAYVVDQANFGTLEEIGPSLDHLETVITMGEDDNNDTISLRDVWTDDCKEFSRVSTTANDPAMILYTSGTTGKPKGAVLAHKTLLGDLPSFLTFKCNMKIQEDDIHWTPSEWAWIGSVYTCVFTSLFYGLPVVAVYRDKPFDPEQALETLEAHGVTVFSTAPAVLRRMSQTGLADDYDLSRVRVIAAGGAVIESPVLDWIDDAFPNAAFHTLYGQTEANMIIGECSAFGVKKSGGLGLPGPGHNVRLLDLETEELIKDPGDVGEIVIRHNEDPVCFLKYWDNPETTEEKVQDGWLRTGDLGWFDADGYFSYTGRRDDIIISSGYRIGPQEIEDTLVNHDAVKDAGVIGVPDDMRGEVPKAFVVLADNHDSSSSLLNELKTFVRERLALYKYPRRIEFVETLPRSDAGKLQRTVLRDCEDSKNFDLSVD